MTMMVALLLVVRVFDVSGESPRDRQAAARVADRILRQAEVTTQWIDCSAAARATPATCHTIPQPGELSIRITPAPADEHPSEQRSLGYSLVDPQAGRGTLGTVFSDRVDWLADASHSRRDTLLGRAIAHEIGHLLLGTTGHSSKGLMRAIWTAADLQRDRREDWLFTSTDAHRIRQARLADDGTRMAGGGAMESSDDLLTITFDDPS
jgi:hypothetical protein